MPLRRGASASAGFGQTPAPSLRLLRVGLMSPCLTPSVMPRGGYCRGVGLFIKPARRSHFEYAIAAALAIYMSQAFQATVEEQLGFCAPQIPPGSERRHFIARFCLGLHRFCSLAGLLLQGRLMPRVIRAAPLMALLCHVKTTASRCRAPRRRGLHSHDEYCLYAPPPHRHARRRKPASGRHSLFYSHAACLCRRRGSIPPAFAYCVIVPRRPRRKLMRESRAADASLTCYAPSDYHCSFSMITGLMRIMQHAENASVEEEADTGDRRRRCGLSAVARLKYDDQLSCREGGQRSRPSP